MKKIILFSLMALFIITGFTYRNLFEDEHLSISFSERQNRWRKACPDSSQLRSGDLVFRHGRGFISNALMNLGQREKKYSHAGLISVEDGNVFVYHAIGGEQNVSNKLRRDKLEDFCNSADVHAFAIFRSDLSAEERQAVVHEVKKQYASGLEFDTKFDLATNDRMYCTEFIYKIFDSVLGNRNYISLSAVAGKQYVSCDDIYCNAHCKNIYTYSY